MNYNGDDSTVCMGWLIAASLLQTTEKFSQGCSKFSDEAGQVEDMQYGKV